ncbi:MAG: ABC-F family ATP-binding cassette domain-containing protein [Bacteroidia bacterium]|nr:ABC-F family ATP-binding cassette domain-containing protein [Bacteroidia bacterium]
MNLLSAENISKNYGEKTLFKNINIGVNQGERIAFIGVNGSGKSTLLKVLSGEENPDEGTVSARKGITIGFLGQNPKFEEDATVFENVFSANHPLMKLIKEYELHHQKTRHTPEEEARALQLVEQMTALHAWEYEHRTKEIISRMGIEEWIHKPVRMLSGGQRKRVAMARVLMEEPDLLILDEPTNHLDLETVEWLENMISERFQNVLIVTHDRYFLDKLTNHIIELSNGETFKYKGNYAYFLEKKAEREEIRNSEIDKAKNLMRKELEWIRRQPKARGTKAKYRVDAFEEIQEKARQKTVDTQLELQIKTSRLGGKTINVKNISKKYGDTVLLNRFSHNFQKGERVGIIGKNGIGKTTFLEMLTGIIPPDTGDVDMGESTIVGYYRQEDMNLNEQKRVIEVVKDIAEVIELNNGEKITASQFLQKFLFPPAQQHAFVSTLSGGEKKRLQLLTVLIKNPNFLILDEPTNDLDIGSLNILEEFLDNFPGTLIIVSHDRYFMDKLVDHLFVFEGNGIIRDFPGNYSDYREWKKGQAEEEKEEKKEKTVPVLPADAPKKESPKLKRSFKEQKEFESLTNELEVLENEKENLSLLLSGEATDYENLIKATNRIEEISGLLEEKELRWLELSELEAYG